MEFGVETQLNIGNSILINNHYRFEYGTVSVLTLMYFDLLLSLFIATNFILSTICQMHYFIFCCAS